VGAPEFIHQIIRVGTPEFIHKIIRVENLSLSTRF
jgi:hypothetical protein